MTLGPEAVPCWSRSLESLIITPTGMPNGGSTRGEAATSGRRSFIESQVDEEKFCHRKIMSELNRIAAAEAQEAKYRHMKLWEEHDKKAAEEVAQRNAHRQAEALARQQAKMMEAAKQQEENMRKEQEMAEAQAHRDMEFSKKQEETRQLQLEAEKQLKQKMKKHAELFQRVYESHQQFSNKYRELLEILKVHEEIQNLVRDDLEGVKTSQERFNSLIAKCKLDQISEVDVLCAQNLLDTISALNVKAKTELAKIEGNRQREREELIAVKRQEEEANRKRLENEKQAQELKEKTMGGQSDASGSQDVLRAIGNCSQVVENSCRFHEYKALLQNFEKVEASLLDFTKDESLKKFRSDCQKAINIPVNAISAQNATHLFDKYKKLLSFLQKQTVVVSDRRITNTSHPLGPLYSVNYLAVKTVKQGEQCVSSNPEAAFPIASVALALWSEIPDYGRLLLSQFHKASPYLIPAYWERIANESDEQYYKRLGFLYSNDEKEDLDKFLKRQSGIMRLYCAIIVTSHNRSNKSKPHPLPISEAWNWLTAFITLPPKADISATMLLEMLEVTGHLMMSNYKTQFRKLLHLICISYLPLVERVTLAGRGGPVTRLRGFLEGLISEKSISPPKGLLPPNFW